MQIFLGSYLCLLRTMTSFFFPIQVMYGWFYSTHLVTLHLKLPWISQSRLSLWPISSTHSRTLGHGLLYLYQKKKRFLADCVLFRVGWSSRCKNWSCLRLTFVTLSPFWCYYETMHWSCLRLTFTTHSRTHSSIELHIFLLPLRELYESQFIWCDKLYLNYIWLLCFGKLIGKEHKEM